MVREKKYLREPFTRDRLGIRARLSRSTVRAALSLSGLERSIFGVASEPDRDEPELSRSIDPPAGTILFDDITALDVSSQTSVFALLQDPRLSGTGAGRANPMHHKDFTQIKARIGGLPR